MSFACKVDSNITMDQMAGIPGEVIKTMSTVEKKEQQPGWGGIYQTGKQSDFGTYGTPLEGPEGKEHSPQRDNYGTQTGSGDQAFYLSGAVMQQSTMASQPKKFMRKAMK